MSVSEKERLKRKAAFGAITLGIKRVLIQIIYTVSNIFLARLLFPQDFGTFAIVTFVVMFFAVFSDLGLGPSLVQKRGKLASQDLQTAFSLHLVLSFVIIFLIFISAPAISRFYNLGQTGVNLFRLYSLYLIFLPFKTASGAVLERNLVYHKLVIIEVLELLAGTVTTVTFAFSGFGVFSFAAGAIINHLIGAILYFSFSPWPVKLAIYKKNLLSLGKFGLPFQAQSWFGLFYGPAILLYLGKAVGSENLGFYQFAASLSALPAAIPEIITRIVFPLGARMQKNSAFFRQIIERSVVITSATSLPIFFILAAAAPALIHFIYTDRWLPALPAFYLGLTQMVVISYTGIFAQLLLAQGKAIVMRNIGIFWAVLTWIIAPPLIYFFNFVGMSLAGLLVSLSGLWLIWRLRKEVDFALLVNFAPFFAAAFVSSFLVFILVNLLPAAFGTLVFALVLGLIYYLGLVLLLARRMLLENFKLLAAILTS